MNGEEESILCASDINLTSFSLMTYNAYTTYFDNVEIYTNEDYDPSESRIIEIIEPSTEFNYITPSTAVDFSVRYSSGNPLLSKVCIELINVTTYQEIFPICQNVSQDGVFTFSTTTTLVSQNQYRWRVVLRGIDNQIVVSSSQYFFTVQYALQTPWTPDNPSQPWDNAWSPVPTSTPISDVTLQCDPTQNFWENSICNVGIMLFVPSNASLTQLGANLDVLWTKQPFSTFNEFKSGWDNATQFPDVEYASLTLVFFGEDSDIISTTSLSRVIGNYEDGLAFLRYLIGAGLWIAFAWFCFIRVSRFF